MYFVRLGKNKKLIKKFINELQRIDEVKVKYNTKPQSILGINFIINPDYILLDQKL